MLTASRPLLRAVGFAGIAVPVSLVGHLSAGGEAPDEATLLLAIVATTVTFRLLLAGRERSWPVLSAALGLAETVLHTLFCSSAHGSGYDVAAPAIPAGMHGSTIGAGLVAVGPGLPMTASHLLAALVLGWFLRNGDRALWAAARRVTVTAGAMLRPLRALLASAGLVPLEPARLEPLGVVPSDDPAHRRYRATGGPPWRGPPVPQPVLAS
jgi:hypothetical protein